jgi:putative redox protein
MSKTVAKWRGDMSFDVELQGHSFVVDAVAEVGGKDAGPRPKPLILSALAGCTGMDVVSILGKMKMPMDNFAVDVSGELTEEHPKVYRSVTIDYKFWGDQLDESKINKAVSLSQDRYCGVSAMLRNAGVELYHTVQLNPER